MACSRKGASFLFPNLDLKMVCSGLLADCETKGYQIAYKSAVPPGQKGYFIPLVILDNPPDDARVVREERA